MSGNTGSYLELSDCIQHLVVLAGAEQCVDLSSRCFCSFHEPAFILLVLWVPAICCGTPPPPLQKNKSLLSWILNLGSATQYRYQLTQLNALRQMVKVSIAALILSIKGSVIKEGYSAGQSDEGRILSRAEWRCKEGQGPV